MYKDDTYMLYMHTYRSICGNDALQKPCEEIDRLVKFCSVEACAVVVRISSVQKCCVAFLHAMSIEDVRTDVPLCNHISWTVPDMRLAHMIVFDQVLLVTGFFICQDISLYVTISFLHGSATYCLLVMSGTEDSSCTAASFSPSPSFDLPSSGANCVCISCQSVHVSAMSSFKASD